MKLRVLILMFIVNDFITFGLSGPPDNAKKIQHMVEDFGYPFEIHNVQTEDGYILEIHNIPADRNESKASSKKNKPVVLAMHGILGSSADWIVTGPNIGLAFLLADKGYDVWLGNNRGNVFSKKHTNYLETSYRFWDFSWHELGIYDLPAMIDYILKTTGQTKLFYIGYSQGCTQFFVMGSLKPEYNNKIRLAVTLAPAVFFGRHSMGVLSLFSKLTYPITKFLETVGHVEVLPASSLMRVASKIFCENIAITKPLCFAVMSSVAGVDVFEQSTTILAKMLPYFPAGCSTKQLLHYGLGFENPNTFRQFDYGSVQNLAKYKSKTPPDYPLEKVNVPIAIYYGTKDILVNSQDIQLLRSKLKNVVKVETSNGTLNHLDFNYGTKVREEIYYDVVKTMQGF